MSPIDGNPIVYLTAEAFAGGAVLESVRDSLVTRAPALLAATDRQAKRGNGGVLLLKDALGDRRAKKSGDGLSTHYAIDFGNGYQENRLLTVEVAMSGASGGSYKVTQTYLVMDPDLDAASDASEGPYQKTAVSLADPSDTRTVTFDDGDFWIEGVEDGDLLIVSSLPIIDETNDIRWVPPYCDDLEPGSYDEDECVWGGGPGGDDPGEPSDPGSPGNSTIPNFPSSMISETYLGLRTLRTDAHGDHGPNLEVQMHIQPTDSYSLQFPKRNWYRFDTAYFSHTLTTLFGGHSADDFLVYGYPGGPAAGSANSQNAVPFPSHGYTRYFQTPDVNDDQTEYDFSNLGADDWVWAYAGDPLVRGYLPVTQTQPSFPLHALNDTPYRAVMIEDDQDVRFFTKRGDGDWEGNVSTYDFSNGGIASVYTEIDADWFSVYSDDVFTNSGYRRATSFNVSRRQASDGMVRTDASGFRYTFTTYQVQAPAPL